ncbi:hypothetical protein BHE74_00054705, partial [Ensete ventricosum]
CPNTSCRLCAVAVAVDLAQATVALTHQYPPCQGVGTPVVGTVAPAGGRAGRGRQSLAGVLPSAPLASDAGLPCGLALAIANRPLVGGLGHDLAMDDRHFMGAGRGWPPLLTAFTVKT